MNFSKKNHEHHKKSRKFVSKKLLQLLKNIPIKRPSLREACLAVRQGF